MGNDEADDLQRDLDNWDTGDEPMTSAQRLYLETLTAQAGEPSPDENLTKAEATRMIEALRTEADVPISESWDIDTDGDPNLDPVNN